MVPSWLFRLLAGVAIIFAINALQVPVADEGLQEPEKDLESQVKDIQKNITDLWVYIIDLRQAMENHLTHLSQHQKSVETLVQKMTRREQHGHDDSHHGDDHSSHSDSGHHHDGDHHAAASTHDDHHDHHSSSDNDHHHSVDSTSHSDTGHHGEGHHDDHQHEDSHHHGDLQSSSGHDHHHDDAHHGDLHTSSGHDHHHEDEHQTSSGHDHHQDHTASDSHDHHHDHQATGSHDHDHGHDEHTTDSHPHQDSHEDHHDHKDSHELGSMEGQQQTQTVENLSTSLQGTEDQQPQVVEKLFTATSHNHHHGHVDSNTPEQPTGSGPLNVLDSHHHHHHNHHHHHTPEKNTSAVVMPKVSDYKLYDFAICDVQPNRAIAQELQQDVRGQVSLWQKKTGGPLNFHLRLRGFKIGDHHGHQMQDNENETPPEHIGGHRHGFHVHVLGDLSNSCQSTGPHYNPLNVTHGGPRAAGRHVGDLGNIECDNNGITNIVFSDRIASLSGDYSILSRSIVIHSDLDDYGLNREDPESLLTGNAGTRIACCVIQKVEKLPLKYYKAMKTATQHKN